MYFASAEPAPLGVKPVLLYYGRTGKVTVSTDEPVPGCYYCKGLWGTGGRGDVQRYVREGVGAFLR